MKKFNLFGEKGILSGKRVFLLTCSAAVLLTGVTSVAASGNIKSQGLIICDNDTPDTSDDVIFDATDLTMLETEIDAATEAAVQGKNDLVDKLKEKLPSSVTDGLGDNPSYDDIAEAIGNIGKGANFTASDLLMGKIGYDGSNLVTGTMPNKGAFTSTGLKAGESLIIPEGYHNGSGYVEAASLASQTGVTGTYTNTHDTEDTSDDTEEDLVAATADNLSLGTAAWVDGQYIVGNGADNNSYYALGYTTGVAESLNSANIQYTYHTHTGNSSSKGGCYTTPVYHSHSNSCYYEATKGELVYDGDKIYRRYTCSHCGNSSIQGDGVNDNGSSTIICSYCLNKGDYKCGKSTSTIESYKLSCGKTTASIESAILTFD